MSIFPPPPAELPKVERLFDRYFQFCREHLSDFGIKGFDASMRTWKTPSWAPYTTYHFLRECPTNTAPPLKVYADPDKKGRFQKFYFDMERKEPLIEGIFQIDLVWRFEWNIREPHPKSGDILALALEHEESRRGNKEIEGTYLGKQLNDLRRLAHLKAYRKILVDRPMYTGGQKEYADLVKIHERYFSKLMPTFTIDSEEQWFIVIIYPDSLTKPKHVQFRGLRFNHGERRLEHFGTRQVPVTIQADGKWTS